MTDPSAGDYHPTEKEATCGEYLGTGFIVGGEITKRGELPYHAALGYKSKRRGRRGKFDYNCGGTLINRYYFLQKLPSHTFMSFNLKILVNILFSQTFQEIRHYCSSLYNQTNC